MEIASLVTDAIRYVKLRKDGTANTFNMGYLSATSVGLGARHVLESTIVRSVNHFGTTHSVRCNVMKNALRVGTPITCSLEQSAKRLV